MRATAVGDKAGKSVRRLILSGFECQAKKCGLDFVSN